MPEDNDWKTVADAAAAHNVPLRTAYNWVNSGRVESKTSGGATLVLVAQFQTLAAQRITAPMPALPGRVAGVAAGNDAGNGATGKPAAPRAVAAPPLDGAQAAVLFGAFDQGETPTDLVQRLQIAPAEALAAWRQWQELKAAATARPTVEARLVDLEQTVAGLATQLAEYTNSGRLAGEVYVARRGLDELRRQLQALPLAGLGQATCGCGHRGRLAVAVRCGACGGEAWFDAGPRT